MLPSATLKQIREKCIADHASPRIINPKMLGMLANALRAWRRHEHERINKIIPWKQPNPNELTISSR